MSILRLILPLMLLVAGSALVAFIWAARRGQLDDLDTPPLRILGDDGVPARAGSATASREICATAQILREPDVS